MATRLRGKTLVEYQYEVGACFCYIYMWNIVWHMNHKIASKTHIYIYVAATFQVYLAFWLVCLVSHRCIGLLGALGLLRKASWGLLGPPGERRCGSGAALPSTGQSSEQPPPPLHPFHPPSSSPSLHSSAYLPTITTTYYHLLPLLTSTATTRGQIFANTMLCDAMLCCAMLC